MNRKMICVGAAVFLALLFASCNMMGPDSGLVPGPDGKAAVSISIEEAGIQERTVLPGATLAGVTAWKLWGGKQGGPETQLLDFSGTSATVHLEEGTWGFTLKGYKDDALILQGRLQNMFIDPWQLNALSFTVAPVLEGSGIFKITIKLPEGHGISAAKVFKDGVELTPSITPLEDVVVFENTYPAGDYFFSFRLYCANDLYGVVSEAVQVRGNLRSEQTYNLSREDLNLTYMVSYHPNNGELGTGEANPDYYQSVDTTLALPIPISTRAGYAFGGWHDNGGFEGSPIAEIPQGSAGDKVFYAKWMPFNYRIDYHNIDGGTNTNPTAYTVESDDITLADPIRTGFIFGGWYSEDSFTTAVTTITTGSMGTKAFYAKWTAITYTALYNANGGSGTTADSAHTYDAAGNLTANNFTRTGYAFTGWNTQADGSGDSFTDAQSVSNLSSTQGAIITLYAQWSLIYSINYTPNGGTNPPGNPVEYIVENLPLALAVPLKTGYTGSWHDGSSGSAVAGIPVGSTGNKAFYAQWTAITYTVRYNPNGGSGTTTDSAHTYDLAGNLTANNFTRTGYAFAGWNTQADGSGDSFTDGQSVSNLSSTQDAIIPLHAQWTGISYTVAYNKNDDGATGDTGSSSHVYGTPQPLTANGFSNTGYAFAGWNTQADGNGTSYPDAYNGSDLSTTQGAIITLYAQWSLPYLISYTTNGGTNPASNPGNYIVEDLPLDLAAPLKTGYTGSWHDNPGFSGSAVAGIPVGSTGNKAFYAQWTAITYTVRYNANGGSGTTTNSAHTYDSAGNLTANNFTRAGYDFAGWNTQPGGSGTSYTDGQSVSNLSSTQGATVTLYAQWTGISYTVAYNKNDDGATGETGSSNHVYGTPKALTANGFSKTHYAFAGWNTKADGSGTNYTNSQSVSNLSSTQGATVTLYAKWTLAAYTIAYVLNNGANAVGNPGSYTFATPTITLLAPTRAGYTFLGWHTEAGFTNTVTQIAQGSAGNKTLYAKWIGNGKDITGFSIDALVSISGTTITVILSYDNSADITSLAPVITVSPDATVSPASGAARDFTNPVSYTVSAEDGSQKTYTVTVKNSRARITAFTFASPSAAGDINETAKTINLAVPDGTDLTALVPAIPVSPRATVDPPSGQQRNFSGPVTYTVSAENGWIAVYTVRVVVRGKGSVTMVFPADAASGALTGAPITLDRSNGDEQTLTVSGDFASCLWRVNGAFKGSGPDITLKALDYPAAVYQITVEVTRGGTAYSKTGSFTVQD